MAEWRGIFFANAIVNFSREARCGGTTDHNDMFIWQNFGLPPSTIDNTDSALQNKTKYLSETQTQPTEKNNKT